MVELEYTKHLECFAPCGIASSNLVRGTSISLCSPSGRASVLYSDGWGFKSFQRLKCGHGVGGQHMALPMSGGQFKSDYLLLCGISVMVTCNPSKVNLTVRACYPTLISWGELVFKLVS